jgi:hypothetical protein
MSHRNIQRICHSGGSIGTTAVNRRCAQRGRCQYGATVASHVACKASRQRLPSVRVASPAGSMRQTPTSCWCSDQCCCCAAVGSLLAGDLVSMKHTPKPRSHSRQCRCCAAPATVAGHLVSDCHSRTWPCRLAVNSSRLRHACALVDVAVVSLLAGYLISDCHSYTWSHRLAARSKPLHHTLIIINTAVVPLLHFLQGIMSVTVIRARGLTGWQHKADPYITLSLLSMLLLCHCCISCRASCQ